VVSGICVGLPEYEIMSAFSLTYHRLGLQVRGLLKHADPLVSFAGLITDALDAGFDPRQAHDTVRCGAIEGRVRKPWGMDAGRTPPKQEPGGRLSPVACESQQARDS